jgi:hypothetical protein
MKNFFLLIILIFLSNNILFSQKVKIGFETGIGEFSMSDLKDMNTAISKLLPFDSKIVSDFPPFLFYEPKITVKIGKLGVGLIYSFQSTGSRVSTKDYSGEYRFDIIVKSNSPGIYIDVDMLSQNKSELSFYTSLKRTFTHLKINEYFNVLDSVLTDDHSKFHAQNYSVEPGILFNRSFGFLIIGINAGYSVSFGKKDKQYFSMIEDESIILSNPITIAPVKPDWSGFRFGLSLFINLNSIFQENKHRTQQGQ